MSKNLKLKKVNKSFVPEPKESRQVFRVFSDSLRLFHIFISWSHVFGRGPGYATRCSGMNAFINF